jgi:hypothetical protein
MPELVYEGSQFQYWLGKQSAQGTPAADAALDLALAVVGGDVSINLEVGQERWPTYGGRFYSSVRWIDALAGQGELQCAGHPSTVGKLLRYFLGGTDTVTGTGPYVHTLATGAGSNWLGLKRRVGVGEGSGAGAPRIERYNDARITQLVIAGSTASKMVRCTPTFLVADPGEVAVGIPSATLPSERPFVYTDGTGAFKFSTTTGTAVVNPDTTSFEITLNDALTAAPGDGVVPLGYLPGESLATIALECTCATSSIQEYNKLIYGHHPLVTGDKPIATVPTSGALDILLSYGAGAALRSFKLTMPNVSWTPTGQIATNTDGSVVTLTFTGEAYGSSGLVVPVITTGDSAAY